MTRNPFINAGAAAVYIGTLVLFIGSLAAFDGQETLLIPISMLSLLVLSVLTMSYCFFLTPVQMCLDGEKHEAVRLFKHSVAVFAGIVAVFFGILLSVR